MKIVLIQLPSPWLMNDRDTPLLGTLHLASNLLAHNVEVQIADLVGMEENQWHIPEGDVYGISITTPQVPLARKAVDLLRGRTSHDICIIGGGPHVSAMPQWSLRHLNLNHVFVGEADEAIVSFALLGTNETILHCKPVDVTKLPPLRRDLVDMRSFHLMGINKYVHEGAKYEGYLQTNRGCPFNCGFCAQACITHRMARPYTDRQVIAELQTLLNKWECDVIYMQDDTFNIDKSRLLRLCEIFTPFNFKWHCLARADLLDAEMCRAMADAGCQNVTFGFESGSNKMLKAMNKCETVEQGLRAAQMVKDAGMGVRGQMIVGYPGEDDETIADTVKFVNTANVDKWGFHAFVPLPGSQSWEDVGIDNPTVEFFETGFHTIGQPGEWAKIWGENNEQIKGWLDQLRALAADKHVRME